jgi:hypothetical protein
MTPGVRVEFDSGGLQDLVGAGGYDTAALTLRIDCRVLVLLGARSNLSPPRSCRLRIGSQHEPPQPMPPLSQPRQSLRKARPRGQKRQHGAPPFVGRDFTVSETVQSSSP